MARMIPRQISDNTQSTAERRIFEKISSDLSEDWIALHSLELAESGKKPWTEVDFVLIGPAGVYCLEVKGGGLRREEGVWYQTGKGGEHKLNRGPVRAGHRPFVPALQAPPEHSASGYWTPSGRRLRYGHA